LKYLVAKKPFSKVEGANQGSPFEKFGHDNQPIIDKGMGRSDHQTP